MLIPTSSYPRQRISPADTVIIAHGNSLTAGAGASSAANYWPALAATLAPLVDTGAAIINKGVGGQAIKNDSGSGTMIATGPAAVDAELVAGKVNILAALEYTNEMKAVSNDAAVAHAAMKEYCLARRAAAAAAGKVLRILVATAPPAGADPLVNGGSQQARIDARCNAIKAANQLMREQYRDYADCLCDLAMLAPFKAIFDSGVYTQEAFQASGLWAMSNGQPDDYTHFGDSGYLFIAQAFARAIARVRH